MNLTDAQKKTIEYFGLEVVERRCPLKGERLMFESGTIEEADFDFSCSEHVVVRPALAARVKELESELAPIRALKVGSWRWGLMRFALGDKVKDNCGRVCAINEITPSGEFFTLHTEPPPAPTADDLCAAIEATAKAWPEVCRVGLFGDAVALAAAYRAANAKGGV